MRFVTFIVGDSLTNSPCRMQMNHILWQICPRGKTSYGYWYAFCIVVVSTVPISLPKIDNRVRPNWTLFQHLWECLWDPLPEIEKVFERGWTLIEEQEKDEEIEEPVDLEEYYQTPLPTLYRIFRSVRWTISKDPWLLSSTFKGKYKPRPVNRK